MDQFFLSTFYFKYCEVQLHMNKTRNKSLLPQGEFIALMAMVTAMVALSTDAMLPALAEIGTVLGA